jgi:hypothetical protein
LFPARRARTAGLDKQSKYGRVPTKRPRGTIY